jgi:transcriptional regulator with PAS, ATPase and Fis domain
VLEDGGKLALGRESRDFVPGALDGGRVSRKHAVVRRRGLRLTLEDLGSRNGTTVNGERIEGKIQLSPGDVIGLGKMLLLVLPVVGLEGPTDHPRIIGRSHALGEVLRSISKVGPAAMPVLILGESGVGKELLAAEIHAASGRPGRLVAVNCATLGDGVVQSELFGHVKGAYSGADRSRGGLVNEARGGTLFLDEIGDASSSLQANLLRLLQEKEVRAVGSDRTQTVDIRFVAATNVPLADAVRSGGFREDLYSRLGRFVLRMPPLRERREDILPLARHFARGFAGRPVRFTQALALALLRHDWPGNVRTLEGLVERLVVEYGDQDELPAAAWLAAEFAGHARFEGAAQAAEAPAPLGRPRKRKPDADELRAMLDRCDGNVTAVAEELGIGRNTLYRWLKARGVDLGEGR